MEMNTLMIKESNFELETEKKMAWIAEAKELLEKFNYEYSEDGIKMILDKWASVKGWLVELFRKSEYYNGNGQIVIPANLKRPVDWDVVEQFKDWTYTQIRKKIVKERELKVGLFTLAEYQTYAERVYDIYRSMRSHSVYNGMTKEQWKSEYERMNNVFVERRPKDYRTVNVDYEYHYISGKDADYIQGFYNLISRVLRRDSDEEINILRGEKLKEVNEKAESLGIKARAAEGQKTTKFIGKVLKEVGLNHVVDIQKTTWRDTNGVIREREKDMGYNYWFAALGDAINPMEYSREVVISVNPFDYWTMSFGYKWASCHTIDKQNIRRGHHDYSGCYSGGTESYMLDESSIIMYVRPTEEELEKANETDEPLELQSKLKRVIFYLGEDKLIQSRVYPDGRDGGDEGIAAQLRAIMQKTISDLYETANMWTLKKGTSECCKVIDTQSNVHYPDYENCSDCNVSYLRRINGNLNTNLIKVGSDIICPNCGDTHDSQEHITCDDCYEGIECYNCGDTIRRNRNDYIEIDGRCFCCEDCARACDYVETEDDGWHYYSECSQDSYDECWYYDDYDGICIGDDWYYNEYNAEADGWRWCNIDEDWYREEDTEKLSNGDYFCKYEHPDAVEIDGTWYLSVEDAEADGAA